MWMFNIIVYTLLEFFNIYLGYHIILKMKLEKKLWIYITTLIIPCTLQILLHNKIASPHADYVIAVSSLCSIPIWVNRKKLRGVLMLPIVYIGISIINTLSSYVLSFITNRSQDEIIHIPVYVLISECTAILVMLLYGYIIGEKTTKDLVLNYKQYILLLIGMLNLVVLGALAESLESISYFSPIEKKIFGFSSMIVALLFVVLNIWYQRISKQEQLYQKQTVDYENYLQKQEERIQLFIQKDDDMKRFRHDFHAHITVLKAYAEKFGDIEFKKYIEEMQMHLSFM